MFQTSTQPSLRITPSAERRTLFAGQPLSFSSAMDLCRQQQPAAVDCDVTRFAAEARKSASRHAFRPEFTPADWRLFSSYCVARRLPAGSPVAMAGRVDRTLRFVVEGSLWQESAVPTPSHQKLLMPGTILGVDGLFSDAPGESDVHVFEDALVLELSLPRQKEMMASCPAIAFELLRAAGAVIASRGRAPESLATN